MAAERRKGRCVQLVLYIIAAAFALQYAMVSAIFYHGFDKLSSYSTSVGIVAYGTISAAITGGAQIAMLVIFKKVIAAFPLITALITVATVAEIVAYAIRNGAILSRVSKNATNATTEEYENASLAGSMTVIIFNIGIYAIEIAAVWLRSFRHCKKVAAHKGNKKNNEPTLKNLPHNENDVIAVTKCNKNSAIEGGADALIDGGRDVYEVKEAVTDKNDITGKQTDKPGIANNFSNNNDSSEGNENDAVTNNASTNVMDGNDSIKKGNNIEPPPKKKKRLSLFALTLKRKKNNNTDSNKDKSAEMLHTQNASPSSLAREEAELATLRPIEATNRRKLWSSLDNVEPERIPSILPENEAVLDGLNPNPTCNMSIMTDNISRDVNGNKLNTIVSGRASDYETLNTGMVCDSLGYEANNNNNDNNSVNNSSNDGGSNCYIYTSTDGEYMDSDELTEKNTEKAVLLGKNNKATLKNSSSLRKHNYKDRRFVKSLEEDGIILKKGKKRITTSPNMMRSQIPPLSASVLLIAKESRKIAIMASSGLISAVYILLLAIYIIRVSEVQQSPSKTTLSLQDASPIKVTLFVFSIVNFIEVIALQIIVSFESVNNLYKKQKGDKGERYARNFLSVSQEMLVSTIRYASFTGINIVIIMELFFSTVYAVHWVAYLLKTFATVVLISTIAQNQTFLKPSKVCTYLKERNYRQRNINPLVLLANNNEVELNWVLFNKISAQNVKLNHNDPRLYKSAALRRLEERISNTLRPCEGVVDLTIFDAPKFVANEYTESVHMWPIAQNELQGGTCNTLRPMPIQGGDSEKLDSCQFPAQECIANPPSANIYPL